MSGQPVPDQAQLLHERARAAGARGDYEQALALFAEARVLAPGWAYPVYVRAEELYAEVDRMEPGGLFTCKTTLDMLRRESAGEMPAGFSKAWLLLETLDKTAKRAATMTRPRQSSPRCCAIRHRPRRRCCGPRPCSAKDIPKRDGRRKAAEGQRRPGPAKRITGRRNDTGRRPVLNEPLYSRRSPTQLRNAATARAASRPAYSVLPLRIQPSSVVAVVPLFTAIRYSRHASHSARMFSTPGSRSSSSSVS